jgi:type IV pilus assembly protein PilQ
MKLMNILKTSRWKVVVSLISLCLCTAIFAEDSIELKDVKVRSVSASKAQIQLEFTAPPSAPTAFSISDPTRMIFDFDGVRNTLSRQMASQNVSAGVMRAINFVEAGDKTRLIINVLNIVPYQIDTDRNKLIITLDNILGAGQGNEGDDKYSISTVDFRRGQDGEGKVVIGFSNDTVPVDFREEDNQLIVEFKGATIPDSLLRTYDVNEFATNVVKIQVERDEGNVLVTISTKDNFDNIAYQLDKEFIVEVRPLSASEAAAQSTRTKYTGDKISLNFQDIEIRSVLQLIADFTGLNIIISDAVQGNVTLHLDNIPWDQALDFILTSKGLAQRVSGNVITIAPKEELASREQLELEAQKQAQALAPLQSEYIAINYAKAADMVTILKDNNNNLLSSRGQITVDARTNTLLIKDTASNIASVKDLLAHLDVPVRQVLIEAQIVQTSDSLNDALGIRFGGGATGQVGKYTLGAAPTMEEARVFVKTPGNIVNVAPTSSTGTSAATGSTTGSGTTTSTGTTSGSSSGSSSSGTQEPMFFNFSAAGANSILGLALARLPGGTLLDLELQAAELESNSKTIARPKLLTLDQQNATIETGQDIPYQTQSTSGSGTSSSSSAATTTSTITFKKAVLKLDVTPHITPNDKISMALSISNDQPGDNINGQVSINTTTMKTNVLVDDNETIVLGGIFSDTKTHSRNAVPYLSDIPIIGRFFSTYADSATRKEVLIFVTPRIVKTLFAK